MYSSKMIYSSTSLFFSINSTSPTVNCIDNNYDNCVFMMKVDLTKKELEVPVMCDFPVLNFIINNFKKEKDFSNYELVHPVYLNSVNASRWLTVKTASDFIEVLTQSGAENGLMHLYRNHDMSLEGYYLGSGIIFDNNMNLLMMSTIKYVLEDNSLRCTGVNLRVTPYTIMHQDSLITKHIYRKVIPILSEYEVNPHKYLIHSKLHFEDSYKPTIIIEDCNNFIIKPNKPHIDNNINETLNDLLVSNYDDGKLFW